MCILKCYYNFAPWIHFFFRSKNKSWLNYHYEINSCNNRFQFSIKKKKSEKFKKKLFIFGDFSEFNQAFSFCLLLNLYYLTGSFYRYLFLRTKNGILCAAILPQIIYFDTNLPDSEAPLTGRFHIFEVWLHYLNGYYSNSVF